VTGVKVEVSLLHQIHSEITTARTKREAPMSIKLITKTSSSNQERGKKGNKEASPHRSLARHPTPG